MLPTKKDNSQLGFYSTFEEQLNHKHPLYILANTVDWQLFDQSFEKHYCLDNGRPAKPIRLMVALLILKHLRNISDESVVEQWSENAYYQYFSGELYFATSFPCEASELVHFRNRIGTEGLELIFKESIRINGDDANENKGNVDTTVQEKNITFPTDNKLHRKIISKCHAIADKEGLEQRQRYTRDLKKLSIAQRFRTHPKNKGKARKADKKVKTIAGRLVRELERKLSPTNKHLNDLVLFKKVLSQQKTDKNKIYSLHEIDVKCISKGKEHKKYEFGNKISLITTATTNVIIGALSIEQNEYDGHTLDAALAQQKRLTGRILKEVNVDRGYRGRKEVDGTQINIPATFSKNLNKYQQLKKKKQFRRRAAIEPKIGHLKSDHRLGRNFYKGIVGDNTNVLLAASAMNFKRMMNKWKKLVLTIFDLSFYKINTLVNLFFLQKKRILAF